jgi:hypothetical protein
MLLEGNLPTDIGIARYVLTDPDHVYVETSRRDGVYFVIRGISYHATCHINWADGEWKTITSTALYVSRGDFSDKVPSDSVKKTIKEAFIKAWAAFVTPQMRRDAAIKQQREKSAEILGKMEELQKQRTKLVEQLGEVQRVLNRLVYRVEYKVGLDWQLWKSPKTDTEEEARELFEEVKGRTVQSMVQIRLLTHNEDGSELVLEEYTTP